MGSASSASGEAPPRNRKQQTDPHGPRQEPSAGSGPHQKLRLLTGGVPPHPPQRLQFPESPAQSRGTRGRAGHFLIRVVQCARAPIASLSTPWELQFPAFSRVRKGCMAGEDACWGAERAQKTLGPATGRCFRLNPSGCPSASGWPQFAFSYH
jgi:hypothetical protein